MILIFFFWAIAGAQGAGRCPCCRQLVHMAFHSISTLIDPSRDKVPCVVVQPCSIASLVQSATTAPHHPSTTREQTLSVHHRATVPSAQTVTSSRERSHRALSRSREARRHTGDLAGGAQDDASRWWLVQGVGSEEMRALKLLQDDCLTESEESGVDDSDG